MGFTKVIRSGNIVELYEYERCISSIRRTPRKERVRKANRVVVAKRRADNVYRLKKNFVRIVQSNLVGDQNPAFVSLTMLQIVPLRYAVACFSRFVRSLRRRVGKDFRYIAVPEFQERGAVHFHVLIWDLPEGYVDEIADKEAQDLIEEDLKEAVGRRLQNLWGHGYCDSIRTNGSEALAGYMAKYMQKSVLDPRIGGEKAYYASRNIMRPMSAGGNEVSWYLKQEVIPNCDPVQVKSFSTEWLGRAIYQKYRIDHAKHDQNDG